MKVTEYGVPGDSIFKSNYSNIRLAQDSKGNIYILNSRYGLYQFSGADDAFVRFDLTGEDPGSEYYDLLIDRKDKFWIAYNRGIKVFNPHDKSSRLIKMPQLQFDVQSCQIKSGHILFLNFNQLYVFYEDPPFNNNVPPVYLTRLLVNGKEYHGVKNQDGDTAQVKRLNLPYRMNTISIEFAALNYLNPQLNRYRYFMTKRDKDTVTVSEGVPADYKSMPPGHYRFWVTGSNNDGLWNTEGTSLDIRIYPPWYRSVIAYLSYALLTIFLMLYYVRRKTNHLREEKLRLQSEIEAATTQLKQKNLQLEEIDRIKTHFFTDISHEIRTPLSLILGPLDNISKEQMLSSRVSGMIDLMKRNAQRLMNLVNQLLDISRLDSGKMKITLIEGDVVKCIRILVYEFLSLAESKQIKYIADLPEKRFQTWFDRDKVEKIITNLLSNAFRYTPVKGTVQCIVRIESGSGQTTPLLIIRITDTGPGISKEHQKRIFERFYRVEGHHENGVHGTGIGLSLVQEFVSFLHGEITVESEPGKGSDFCVTIPLGKDHLSLEDYVIMDYQKSYADVQYSVTIPEYHETLMVKTASEGRIRLLIIEDNEDLRNFMKEALGNEYVILESVNGKAGLNTAFTMMPDLIITDIMMPDLDGISLCKLLKNDERTSHIPVIMLTAKATTEDKIAGLRTGADDYIVKPFNMTELTERISNLLAMRDRLKLKYGKFNLLDIGANPPESVDDRFMIMVLKAVRDNIKDYSFDVGSLQEQLGMSRTHLTRKLKILTGFAPGALIRNLRLEKAA
nr:hybrid sensor histidine kinase/response regulator transcription factor [Bacteroidota bacterium]